MSDQDQHLKTKSDRNDTQPLDLRVRLGGLLLGTAVGDALGLPAEGLSKERIRRLWGGRWKHRLLFRYGMLSDDSEHALMVGQALLQHPSDERAFARALAWKLRWWLAALPAGVGLATLRSILKLWLGFPPHRSGVRSAGNGPAMRSALIGAFFANDSDRLRAYVEASTRLTHTDPRALTGALAVAQMAVRVVGKPDNAPPSTETLCALLSGLATPGDQEWRDLVEAIAQGWRSGWTVAEFAQRIGCTHGVSGYIYRTVPVAVYAWRRHYGDYAATLMSVLDLGGDTDTVGAIAGALAGCVTGPDGIPERWRSGIVDWPRSLGVFTRVAERLAHIHEAGASPGPVGYCWPAVPLRNALFLLVVLAHGFRRLLPPYK